MSDLDIIGGAFRDIIFYGNVHSQNVLEMPGGTGYNVFAGLRELGIQAKFHCATGDDWPYEPLQSAKGKSGIFVCRNEDEVLAVYRGTNLNLQIEKLETNILFATLECGGDKFFQYAKDVKSSGGIVILDPSPIFEWRDEYSDLCDILIPNEREFEKISPLKSKKYFLKLGEHGGMYMHGDVKISESISQNGNFPLGCGDAFDVAVVYGFINRMNPAEILKMAIKVGEKASFIMGSSSAVMEAVKILRGE
jgi:sugar/nucleoside kinase (ribokinase family)